MKLIDAEIITPKDKRIEKLEERVRKYKDENTTLKLIFRSFFDMFTEGFGEFCYCKNCQVLDDTPEIVCIYYDETNPRPSFLCVLYSLMLRFDSNHAYDSDIYDDALLTLLKTFEAWDNGQICSIGEMISKYAPQFLEKKGALEKPDGGSSADG